MWKMCSRFGGTHVAAMARSPLRWAQCRLGSLDPGSGSEMKDGMCKVESRPARMPCRHGLGCEAVLIHCQRVRRDCAPPLGCEADLLLCKQLRLVFVPWLSLTQGAMITCASHEWELCIRGVRACRVLYLFRFDVDLKIVGSLAFAQLSRSVKSRQSLSACTSPLFALAHSALQDHNAIAQ